LIYYDIRKRRWLASYLGVPIGLITRIKRCHTVMDAITAYGNRSA
jgi:hypothetical protein